MTIKIDFDLYNLVFYYLVISYVFGLFYVRNNIKIDKKYNYDNTDDLFYKSFAIIFLLLFPITLAIMIIIKLISLVINLIYNILTINN